MANNFPPDPLQASLPAAAPPLPPLAAEGAPIEPAMADNSLDALPPELLEIIMMILSGGLGPEVADPNAANPIAAELLGAQPNPAGLDGQSLAQADVLPPIDDVVQ